MSLIFWFDVHSPWCYLAAHRIGDVARKHGLELHWRPLHLPRLMETINGMRPLEQSPARVAWFQQDIADHAELMGLPFRYHSRYPLRNSRALRASLYAADQGKAEEFALLVLNGYWAEEADISDLGQLSAWGELAGLDGSAVAAAAEAPAFKARLEANTSEAIGRGVFGVPTVDSGRKLYFGNDRLDLLNRHLSRGDHAAD